MQNLVRKNIWDLAPYSCARDEFKGEAKIYLDANENPYGTYNRYPDPLQMEVKEKIAGIKGVPADHIMLGNGSDEPIDLIYRIFCEPGVDNVVGIAPSYGMYKVCADVNNVEYREALLEADTYEVKAERILALADKNTKVVWFCSPNNPTGNSIDAKQIEEVLAKFNGIVVVDEAYIDFSASASWLTRLKEFPKLIVLQTFSKAWGMAGVRCGMCFAQPQVIALFNKVKYPYNINILTQQYVSERLNHYDEVKAQVAELISSRKQLAQKLENLPIVEKVFASDANFLLAKFTDANAVYNYLVGKATIVRNRNKVKLCAGCIRITIGTPAENADLIAQLKTYA